MEEDLPILTMENLLKKAGAKRVSESAKLQLQKILFQKITKITRKANNFSNHAGRKTIKKSDIELVIFE